MSHVNKVNVVMEADASGAKEAHNQMHIRVPVLLVLRKVQDITVRMASDVQCAPAARNRMLTSPVVSYVHPRGMRCTLRMAGRVRVVLLESSQTTIAPTVISAVLENIVPATNACAKRAFTTPHVEQFNATNPARQTISPRTRQRCNEDALLAQAHVSIAPAEMRSRSDLGMHRTGTVVYSRRRLRISAPHQWAPTTLAFFVADTRPPAMLLRAAVKVFQD